MKVAILGYGKMGQIIEKIALERGHNILLKINLNNKKKHRERRGRIRTWGGWLRGQGEGEVGGLNPPQIFGNLFIPHFFGQKISRIETASELVITTFFFWRCLILTTPP